jgi:hypothetical protein
MSFHSVKEMLDRASHTSVLDTLSPEEYVAEIADQLLTLADEFPGVTLRISQDNIPRLCADLRVGQRERLVEEFTEKGYDPDDVRSVLKPDDFKLPQRIETYAAIYPSVEIKLNAHLAHLLASDLRRGIAYREQNHEEGTV